MRTEHPDIRDDHRSESPSCLNCGLPLAEHVEVCPFCDHVTGLGVIPAEVPWIGIDARRLVLSGAVLLGVAGLIVAAIAAMS